MAHSGAWRWVYQEITMQHRLQVLTPSLRALTAALATAITWGLLVSNPAVAQTDSDIGNTAAVWRATSRLGYGPTPASAQAAQAAGAKAWALQQIDEAYAASKKPPNIPADLAVFNAPLNELARDLHADNQARKMLNERKAAAAMTPAMTPSMATGTTSTATNTATAVLQDNFKREMVRTSAAWGLMACSDPSREQPLLAKMTEFWFNHLNVSITKNDTRVFAGNYKVSAIRPNALGKFEDLLLASARHPAMLLYLDQAQSNAKGLNENYARELMELHTLGVDAGYTQSDVRELARILTGWGVQFAQSEGFKFNPRQHDTGEKTLLGKTFSNAGIREGEEAIRMLAHHPATAQRIARRLATTFITDKPSQALVDKLAVSFLRSVGDIRTVMQTLVEQPEFWQADNTLFKTPLDFACSALTAQGGAKDQRDIQQTLGFLNQAGQPLHAWQTPDGYKTDAATWLAPEALTRRADYALNLGGRMSEPLYLQPFLSAASRDRIAREAPNVRTGLLLASPDFMNK
jgi:uncharacterized protein (DUF1800 family)